MKYLCVGIVIALAIILFSRETVAPTIRLSQELSTTTISIYPEKIIQGNPVMIQVDGPSIRELSFGNKQIPTFVFNDTVTAFIPIDLNKKPGVYPLVITLADNSKIEKDIVVAAREKIEAPLGIPAKLGGNTTASQKKLVDTLAIENATLLNILSADHALWTKPFAYPLAKPLVTDDYGYTRQTGAYSIAHKGTDFRAAEGTPVLAMNDGVVAVVREYIEYGKTIIIDHGLGLKTFYMHLSKITVKAGESVTQGQIIGLSGQTGYAEQPHLHLTLRIGDISVDPIVFLNFFKAE